MKNKFRISFDLKNWNKEGVPFLNRIAYAGLAALTFAMIGDVAGYHVDFLTPQQKKIAAIIIIAFKFIDKLSAPKEQLNKEQEQ